MKNAMLAVISSHDTDWGLLREKCKEPATAALYVDDRCMVTVCPPESDNVMFAILNPKLVEQNLDSAKKFQEFVKERGKNVKVGVMVHTRDDPNKTYDTCYQNTPVSLRYFSHADDLGKQEIALVKSIVAGNSDGVQDAVNRIVDMVCDYSGTAYQKTIEILSAFLPADLAWQTTTGGDAKNHLPNNQEDIRQEFETIRRFTNACLPPESVPQEAIDAVAQFLDASSSCSLFTQLPAQPEKFHAHYVALRDRLFEIVEAIERTQGQKA